MTDFYRKEYSLGLGAIAMYMVSIYYQADLRIREERIAGAHLNLGYGFANAFLMTRLGYDTLAKRTVGELGLTVKIPVYGWK